MEIVANVKARRVKGGALVRVLRGGRERVHRISLRRYHRLTYTLVVHRGKFGGVFTGKGFEVDLTEVAGLSESRKWAARHAGRAGAKWWR